jgi:selenocysteine-specific elongation factor
VFAASWVAATRAAAAATLAAREGELDPGLPVRDLLGPVPWSREIAPLLALERRDGKLYLPGSRPGVDRRRAAAEALALQLASAGLEPIRPNDAELARRLEREGGLVRLGDGLAIGADAYERARQLLVGECDAAGTITLARFRDLLGTSRRVAQLLLERFDADRVTLRVGETRRLRRSARPPGRV